MELNWESESQNHVNILDHISEFTKRNNCTCIYQKMDHVDQETTPPKPLRIVMIVDGGPFFPHDPELLALDACSRRRTVMWVGSAFRR